MENTCLSFFAVAKNDKGERRIPFVVPKCFVTLSMTILHLIVVLGLIGIGVPLGSHSKINQRFSMPCATKAKSIPIIPIVLTIGAICGLAVLAERMYHRPRETVVDLVRAGMLLAGIREETCNLAGVAMHYYCAGRRGTPLVLIHGLGGSAESWAALVPFLSKEYLVYAPDLPGFGRTPLAPEGTNIRTHVLYLERFLDVLGYPRVTLVGNSLGGWIATRFAVEHPECVERLYLLNSAGLRRENMHIIQKLS